MKRFVKITIVIIVLILVGSYTYWRTRDYMDMLVYDIVNENSCVLNENDLNKLLSSYKCVSLGDLSQDYIGYSNSNDPKYKKILKGTQYYLITKKDVYRKIVGNVRVKDLMSKDKRYCECTCFSDDTLVWGIDKRILFKVLELQNNLESKGYNRNGFSIRNGHRHPAYNEKIGGASLSRHIRGEAVDMIISDINMDGKYTDADKQIIIDVCDKEVIKNKGGIGRYPGSRTVHIDVRGFRARWDSY